MAITEDYVHAPSNPPTNWQQHNYYSHLSNNLPLTGQGINYQDSADYLKYVSFSHVARGIFPSPSGSAGVLPATMNAGTPYQATLTGTLSSSWNVPFVKVVVMLIRSSDGVILNSNTASYWPTSVTNITASINKAVVYPNPAATEANVAIDLSKAASVQVNITDMLGRTVYNSSAASYAAGEHHLAIPIANLASGTYNVTIHTDGGSVTQKLSVVK